MANFYLDISKGHTQILLFSKDRLTTENQTLILIDRRNIMNYFTHNKNILEAMEVIFATKFPANSKVNIAITYSHHRKMSMAILQIEDANFYHALILVFTKSLTLYDVVKYYKAYVRKYGIMSRYSPPVEVIKRFIFKNIPTYNPLSNRKLKENEAADNDIIRIEKLKNQIDHLKNKNRFYRDEIAHLKDNIKLLKK